MLFWFLPSVESILKRVMNFDKALYEGGKSGHKLGWLPRP
ncbi:hypothetical protein HNQ64_001950 [Prosthecobacter dejongeii]|uniref:Uncharacterized protein n=1 Tax=Prosthecobacter dejongeii TaxID=48465 RepID=A0A7W8DQ90_9BACT|nr:hypothetical protein [Prosthecobacter dejongeii]